MGLVEKKKALGYVIVDDTFQTWKLTFQSVSTFIHSNNGRGS